MSIVCVLGKEGLTEFVKVQSQIAVSVIAFEKKVNFIRSREYSDSG
jgi:hypothetical protein